MKKIRRRYNEHRYVMVDGVEHKYCNKKSGCGELKHTDAFYKNIHNNPQTNCIDCKKKRSHKYYAKKVTPEKRREYSRNYQLRKAEKAESVAVVTAEPSIPFIVEGQSYKYGSHDFLFVLINERWIRSSYVFKAKHQVNTGVVEC